MVGIGFLGDILQAPSASSSVKGILESYAVTFGWALVGAVSMGIALIIMLKIFTWSTVGIDEWEELKKGNIAVAIVIAAVIIGAALVVSFCVMPVVK
ncbi:MAG: DUF350 domain-containing protein [Planctomycetota bacterium]|nr:DUF350 domain-containing protein [Planctomycetota bacterium]